MRPAARFGLSADFTADCEEAGVPVAVAKEALALAAAKLPVKTRFIERIAE